MAKQNIYDNDSFFENFKNLRNNKINFNDCIETPILLAMIPEVNGKRVLDIGCGMGQHAKQYSDMGAESVLGIDISEKMLEYGYDLHIDNELVAAAFAELPQQAQSILILHCVLELADGEIGALMGMSRSAVQRHRTKTLKELRTKLMALMPEGG